MYLSLLIAIKQKLCFYDVHVYHMFCLVCIVTRLRRWGVSRDELRWELFIGSASISLSTKRPFSNCSRTCSRGWEELDESEQHVLENSPVLSAVVPQQEAEPGGTGVMDAARGFVSRLLFTLLCGLWWTLSLLSVLIRLPAGVRGSASCLSSQGL